MAKRFKNKVVIITGAASGLGQATAEAFAKEGAKVCILDVQAQALNKVERELKTNGHDARAIQMDVRKREECFNAVGRTAQAFGTVDVLVNCAGTLRLGHVEEFSEENFRHIFDVNVSGTFFMCQAAIPIMKEQASGNIVNIASSSYVNGQPYGVAYSASKAAVAQMTKAMAAELIKTDIRINAIAPGQINTPMVANPNIPEGVDFDLLGRHAGLRATSEPTEIAEHILHLASDTSKSLHGSVLNIDSGETCY